MPTAKREKKVRAKGEPQPAIQWFQDQAKESKDSEKIKGAAEKQEYSKSTISIQLGRLRAMGLLPPLEKPVTEKKEKVARVVSLKAGKKPVKSRSFHPVPKPGQKETTA